MGWSVRAAHVRLFVRVQFIFLLKMTTTTKWLGDEKVMKRIFCLKKLRRIEDCFDWKFYGIKLIRIENIYRKNLFFKHRQEANST